MFRFIQHRLGLVLSNACWQYAPWQIALRAFLILALWFAPLSASARASAGAVLAQPARSLLLDNPHQETITAYPDTPFVPGEILVGLRANRAMAASTSQSLSMQFSAGLDPCAATPRAVHADGQVTGAAEEAATVVQRFVTPVGQEWRTIEQLRADPAVLFAEPNWLVQAADWSAEAAQGDDVDQDDGTNLADNLAEGTIEAPFLVNDPLYEQSQWYMQRINASRAWPLAQKAGAAAGGLATIRVSIIDSGIDLAHPDLSGLVTSSKNYVTLGNSATDDYGHGTHIAGLIGAKLNNNLGIAGPALNVQLDVRKVLDDRGQGSIVNVAQGIKDATDAGVQIINLSLQVGSASTVMHNCVKYAYANGVLLIAASGNFFPSPVQWPAAFPEVLAVAATDYSDKHASYSDAGPEVEIAAPGGDTIVPMLSTWPSDVHCSIAGVSPAREGYCANRGTSMAAAVVSGVAALVWSVQPALTAEEVRSLLKQTAMPLDAPETEIGKGRLDALAAMRLALPGDFLVSTDQTDEPLNPGADPFTITVRMDNPSLLAATWQATLAPTSWLTSTTKLSGIVRYGSPAYVTLSISPTHLATGRYHAPVQLVATLANSQRITKTLNIALTIGKGFSNYYFPTILYEGPSIVVADMPRTEFAWEVDSQQNRQKFGMFDNLYQSLPFSMTLKDKQFTDIRLHADGFVSFPASGSVSASLPNGCLPTAKWPQQALFGWWTELDLSAAASQVSTFQPGTDRVVYEFLDVPVGRQDPSNADEKVSFQMVLYADGRMGLNYLHTPSTLRAEFDVTVGVSLLDSRFHNQVACKDATREIGILPQSGQSLIIRPEDIY